MEKNIIYISVDLLQLLDQISTKKVRVQFFEVGVLYEFKGFYISGEWTNPVKSETIDIINPADETVIGKLNVDLGGYQ